MKASVRKSGEVSIIDLEGRLVAGDQALRAAIDDLLADGKRKILVNMVGVAAIDSSGVGDLVGSKKLVEKSGAKLKLLIGQGKVRHVLDAMLLLPVFETFDDETAAVASFPAGDPAT
jgi:anti-sigma B factor antagonist